MSVLWKCCLRSLKENKRRTIVTIFGVALATALIAMVACMGTSFLGSFTDYNKQKRDWHVRFTSVSGADLKYFTENQALDGIWIAKRKPRGWMNVVSTRNASIEVTAPEKGFYEHEKLQLKEGRLPQADGELLIHKSLRSEYGIDLKVGDTVTIRFGDEFRKNDPENPIKNAYDLLICEEEKTYKIVGIMRDSYISSLLFQVSGQLPMAYTYEDEATFTREEDARYDVYVRYQKKQLMHLEEINAALLGTTLENYNRVYNPSVTQLMQTIPSDVYADVTKRVENVEVNAILAILEEPNRIRKDNNYALIGVVIISAVTIIFLLVILAGVFCINNSFDVSFTERIRFYGILASVGTTKRQKRGIVWIEAFCIGLLGIPLGILLGVLFTMGIVGATNSAIQVFARKVAFTLSFHMSWWGILIATVLSAFMICLSAMESAMHASKVMPLEAIRQNDVIRSKKKKKKEKPIRTPRLVKRLFGIGGAVAYQNFRRSKFKYRATIVSITISVALFVGTSFMGQLFEQVKQVTADESGISYQVYLSVYDGKSFEIVKNFASFEGVTRAGIFQSVKLRNMEESLSREQEEAGLQPGYTIYLEIMDQDSFVRYCERLNVNPEAVEDRGIVRATRIIKQKEKDGTHSIPNRFVNLKEGDVLSLVGTNEEYRTFDANGPKLEIELALQTDELPEFYGGLESEIYVFVNEAWISKLEKHGIAIKGYSHGSFLCEDANALEDAIDDSDLMNYYLINYDEIFKMLDVGKALTQIFLVAFLSIIIMIGVTNVINAVSTNMELRAPEFAKLKAVGMTEKQFKGMLWTEGFFIGGKGLLYGLLIGYFVSYAMERFFWEGNDMSYVFHFHVPILQTILSVVAVVGMLMTVLYFGRRKLERKNLIETIRSENI